MIYMASKKEIKNFFDNYVEEREKAMQSHGDTYNRHRLLNTIIKEAALTKNNTIIDIGCGSGEYIKTLEEKRFRQTYGIDFSKEMLKSAKKNTSNTPLSIGDLENTAIKNKKIDTIIMISVLQYISGYKKTLKEMHRILKPEGKLIIQVINLKGQNIKNMITRKDKYDFDSQPKNQTLDLDYENIKHELEKAGFQTNRERRFGFVFSTCPKLLLPINKLLQSLIEKTPLTSYGRDLLIISKKKE